MHVIEHVGMTAPGASSSDGLGGEPSRSILLPNLRQSGTIQQQRPLGLASALVACARPSNASSADMIEGARTRRSSRTVRQSMPIHLSRERGRRSLQQTMSRGGVTSLAGLGENSIEFLGLERQSILGLPDRRSKSRRLCRSASGQKARYARPCPLSNQLI